MKVFCLYNESQWVQNNIKISLNGIFSKCFCLCSTEAFVNLWYIVRSLSMRVMVCDVVQQNAPPVILGKSAWLILCFNMLSSQKV